MDLFPNLFVTNEKQDDQRNLRDLSLIFFCLRVVGWSELNSFGMSLMGKLVLGVYENEREKEEKKEKKEKGRNRQEKCFLSIAAIVVIAKKVNVQ